MNLEYAHEPNYFLFAQVLVRFLEQQIHKNPEQYQASYELKVIRDVFQQDHAASTTNLESILNIADEYTVDTLDGPTKIIESYHVNIEELSLILNYNPKAVAAIHAGQAINEPDATSYQ
ncbi:hypothetical protein [Acinetobacter larvae]|uniref:Uncharacterized protein n=1 Tax=Acinetobacter larvae TaxID=1789224 RepID=A0A1B2LWP5_9GAMM|nr:hypothetical protein [Acinetobacter larvae]AOA57370.1 hypothetical protein BFG52_02680 [Acinetobacter larvae]